MLVCLQVLIEKVIAMNQQAFIMFIDYSKAFDSVCHSQLFDAFLEKGFPKTPRYTATITLRESTSYHQMEWRAYIRV